MTTIILVPLAVHEEEQKSFFDPLTDHLASIFDASITIIAESLQLQNFRASFNEQKSVKLR